MKQHYALTQPRRVLALVAGLWLLLATAARAQAPANDDPCGAVTLTPQGNLCLTPTVSTNTGATTTVPNGYTNPGNNGQLNGCGQATSPKDVWFKFTTAASGLASFGATLTVSGNAAGLLRLYAAPSCAGPFASIGCSGGTTNNSVAARLITGALTPNTTYYVQVAGYGSTDVQGPFTICLTDGVGAPECRPVSNISITYPAGLQPGQGVISFTPGANNVPPYTVTIAGNGLAPRYFNTTTSSVTVDGLVAGGSQTATVSSACSFGGSASVGYALNVPARNRSVCDATPLGVNPTCVPTGGNLFNSSSSGRTGCGQSSQVDYKCQWFKFTTAASGPASTQASVTLSSNTGANELQVWSGNPCPGNNLNALTLLGCATHGSPGSGTPVLPLTGLSPATTYYVQVGATRYAGGNAGLFTVCVTAPGGCSTPNLSVGSVTGTSAVVNFSPLFTASPPQGYTLTYQAAGGPLQTLSPAPSAPAATLSGLLPGTTYTVTLVANCDGGGASVPATATFTTAATAPTCAPATNVTIGNITSGTATVSFTPAAGASAYTVSYQAAGSSAQVVLPAPLGSPVALTGLLPNTAYAVLVTAVCAGGSAPTQAVSFTTPALTGAGNDNCATATPLPVGPVCQFTLGTSAGATASTGVPSPGCASATTIYDVWFSLVVPANGIVQVTTAPVTGSPVTDTGLALYGGTCGSLSLLGCNDDYAGGGDFSQLRLTGLTPGATLYARVWRLGGGSTGGSFNLCATTDAPACAPVANVAFSAITTTGGTLSFTAPGGGGSYAITATPANGQPSIFTGTGSPVALTGLQPGTSYTVCVTTGCGGGITSAPVCTTFSTLTSPCPGVTAPVISNPGGTTATLSFTPPAGGASGGYTITLTPLGGGGAGSFTTAASPVTLTGLTPGASYMGSIVSNCGAGSLSAPVIFSFINSPYCTSALGGTCGPVISNVRIAATPLNSSSTCTVLAGPAYASYPAAGTTTADLGTGNRYQLSVTTTASSDIGAWIDFNHDFVFSTSEYFPVGLATTANQPATATLTVPVAAALGPVAMRVRSRAAGSGIGAADPCATFATGETEDYILNLVLGTAVRAGALAAQVTLYPNPATTAVTLVLPASLSRQPLTASFYNSLGQLVRQQPLPARHSGLEARLDLRGLACGVYSVQLPTAAGLVVKRLVVE